MKRQVRFILLITVLLCWPLINTQAQEQLPDGPVYIVQAGDSLWAIAQRFGVSMDELATANGIIDPGQLAVGAQLVIPGLEGVQGVLVTDTIPFGEDLQSLSHRFQIPVEIIIQLNQFTSPDEVYAGGVLIIPVDDEEQPTLEGGRITLKPGQSLMELAIIQGVSPWTLALENQLQGSWQPLPGENLYLAEGDHPGPGALPNTISDIQVESFPLIQGHTLVLSITAPAGISFQGHFYDRDLNFFPTSDGFYVALQGIHTMLDPGMYPLSIQTVLPDGTPVNFSQNILIEDGNYPFDPPLVVDSETVDVENTTPEDLQWFDIVDNITPEKYWQGIFQSPVILELSDCFPSRFGNRRSYNGSAYDFFHTGLDFCGRTGNEIFAPAAGQVVFVGALTVRGNATVISHGWGVYTAYGHQSEWMVAEGDWVEPGQVIGLVGETGRVSGPHLHWEIIVGGVQVDPLQWLERAFPFAEEE